MFVGVAWAAADGVADGDWSARPAAAANSSSVGLDEKTVSWSTSGERPPRPFPRRRRGRCRACGACPAPGAARASPPSAGRAAWLRGRSVNWPPKVLLVVGLKPRRRRRRRRVFSGKAAGSPAVPGRIRSCGRGTHKLTAAHSLCMTGLSAAHLIAVSDSPFRPQRGAAGSGRFYLRRKSTMARTASLSGFPEWLPEERLVELHVLDTLRRVFELHGFSSIETRAVETVGQLLRKGEIDKEVYGLSRLQDEEGEPQRQPRHRQGRSARPRPALRPHGAVRPVRRGERRLPGVPVPPLPDPEGLARRASAGGPRPRVHPGGHRRGGRRRAAVPLRRRDRAGHRRGPERPADPGLPAPDQQPQAGRGLLQRHRTRPTPPACCAASTSWRRSARPRWPSCSSPSSAPPTSRRSRPSSWPRSAPRTPPSWSRSARWASATNCSRRA